MPKRVIRATVILVRDGQRIVPPIGKLFDLTDKELAQINKLNPDAVEKPGEPQGEYIAPAGKDDGDKTGGEKTETNKGSVNKGNKAPAAKADAGKAEGDDL